MKICAVICEYNPMHAGHAYLLEQARQLTEADYVLCLMSGSFVQRGENAVFSKYERTRCALENGADAVIELPQVFSLQSAEYFAFGAVLCAEMLGCTHLCFGSECGDMELLQEAALQPRDVQDAMENGVPYGKALHQFEGEPNNVLGVEYLRAIRQLDSALVPVTVKRDTSFAGASFLRQVLHKNETHKDMIPVEAAPLFAEAFFPLIKYKIIITPESRLKQICGVNEGLENKIKKEALNADNLDDLIQSIKSKRYPYSRISRILFCLLLDITKDKLQALLDQPPKCKLLGLRNDKGMLLSILKNFYISPVDAVQQDESTALSANINVRATQVYSILSDMTGDEDYTTGLIKL